MSADAYEILQAEERNDFVADRSERVPIFAQILTKKEGAREYACAPSFLSRSASSSFSLLAILSRTLSGATSYTRRSRNADPLGRPASSDASPFDLAYVCRCSSCAAPSALAVSPLRLPLGCVVVPTTPHQAAVAMLRLTGTG